MATFLGTDEDIETLSNYIISTFSEKIPLQKNKRLFMEELVEHLGGEIVISSAPTVYEEESGSLVIYPSGKFIIRLSATTSPLRDNFTIAHELGHYFLHYPHNEKPQEEYIFARFGNGPDEWQANRFAAAFLMPKEEFIEQRKKFHDSATLIAAYFNVSRPAVEKRMEYVLVP